MDDESPSVRFVREEAARGGDVIAAVDLALDKALVELDDAIAESERELAEADVLFEEAEGDTSPRNHEIEDDSGPEPLRS